MGRNNGTRFRRIRSSILSGTPACHLCGKPIDLNAPRYLDDEKGRRLNPEYGTADHVIPVAKGGTDSPHNLRPAHFGCNSRKNNRMNAPMLKRSSTLN